MKILIKNSILIATVIMLYVNYNCEAQAPETLWQYSYGSTGGDVAYDIKETSDGGLIVAANVVFDNGDATQAIGNGDYWVLKLNDEGQIEWQKTLGSSGIDIAFSIAQLNDGGYVVAGIANTNDNDVEGIHGNSDIWAVKLSSNGDIIWKKSLGGSGTESVGSIIKTNDGGCLIAGITGSNDGDITNNHGETDAWIVKLSTDGNIEWQKTYGGSNADEAKSIKQTSDGGYIFAGASNSSDGDVSDNYGDSDFWIVKLSDTGNIEWQKSIGTTSSESAYGVDQTTDGGFAVIGNNSYDYIVDKLDANGNLQWQKTYGGSDFDWGYTIAHTMDNGMIIGGVTLSNDGDVSGNHGTYDFWVLQLNDTGKIVWQKCLGGSQEEGSDNATLITTSDTGIVLTGASASSNGDLTVNKGFRDVWVIKLKSKPESNGIEDIQSLNRISVFPNPATNIIYLKSPDNNNHLESKLFDMEGRLMMDVKNENKIDISSLAGGVYQLDIIDGHSGNKKNIKIIKQL